MAIRNVGVPGLGQQEDDETTGPERSTDPFADFARKPAQDPFADFARGDTGNVDLRRPEDREPKPIRLDPVVVTPRKRISVPAIAASDASSVARRSTVAPPHRDLPDRLATAIEATKQAMTPQTEALASFLTAPLESVKNAVVAPSVGEARPNPSLSKGGNSARLTARQLAEPYDVEHGAVTPRERLTGAAQVGAMAAGPLINRLVTGGLANAAVKAGLAGDVAETGVIGGLGKLAPTVGAATEGATVGAAYDPEHPVRGAALGGALGGLLEAAPRLQGRKGIRAPEMERVLPRQERPAKTATARVTEEPRPSAEPDFEVAPPSAEEAALTSRLEQIRQELRAKPAPEPPVAGGARAPEPAPTSAPSPEVVPEASVPAGGVRIVRMPVADIVPDPTRFQYKRDGDMETGAGTELKGLKQFDEHLAGVVSVWQDPETGVFHPINGHNRIALAKRTGHPSVNVQILPAKTAEEARAMGALANIAEGRGTALDAAQFFRNSGLGLADLQDRVSFKGAVARQGLGLSQLPPDLFAKVERGDLPESHGAVIGSELSTPDEMRTAAQAIDGKRLSDAEVREVARQVRDAGSEAVTQDSLFGTETAEVPLFAERAQLATLVKRRLAQDKRLFGFVAKDGRAEALARGGNVIDAERSQAIADDAGQLAQVFETLYTRSGPIASALTDAARQVAHGARPKDLIDQLYPAIRAAVQEAVGGGKAARGGLAGAGDRAGQPATDRGAEPRDGVVPDSTDPQQAAIFERGPGYHEGPDLFGDMARPEPSQSSLFGEDAGTERSRSLAETERAARSELAQLAQRPSLTPAQATRKATLEKLVNRGQKITADELATQAQARLLESAPAYGAEPRAPFYSRLERAIEAAPFEKGTAAQWKAQLSKNVAASEREWTGIDQFLDQQTGVVTKAQVRQAFEAGKISLKTTVLEDTDPTVYQDLADYAERDLSRQLEQDGLSATQAGTVARYARFESRPWQTPKDLLEMAYGPAVAEQSATKVSDQSRKLAEAVRQAGEEERAARRRGKPKFSQYTEPGGTNYREHLIQLDRSRRSDDAAYVAAQRALEEWHAQHPDGATAPEDVAARQEFSRLSDARDRAFEEQNARRRPFTSNHFDKENILAHFRTKGRIGPNGEKVLHIEEIQSDWHQKGRKKGYRNPANAAALARAGERIAASSARLRKAELALGPNIGAGSLGNGISYWDRTREEHGDYAKIGHIDQKGLTLYPSTTPEQRAALEEIAAATADYTAAKQERERIEQQESEVAPDAPFKKTEEWAMLAVKHAIDEAVAGGYDRIVWTNGERQAARYDLSKQVDELDYDPASGRFIASRIADGTGAVHRGTYDPKALESVVGKEAAAKLLATTPDSTGHHVLRGDELKVGGEGMKAFYDRLLPKTLAEYTRKIGAPVTIEPVHLPDTNSAAPFPSFRITPELKAKVQQEGQYLMEPVTAYHGSPHRFERFSLQKIGSGEGNQAYGYGLYFTDTKAIAAWYREMLTRQRIEQDPAWNAAHRALYAAVRAVDDLGFDSTAQAVDAIQKHADWASRWILDPAEQAPIADALATMRQRREEVGKGALYHVRLPDDETMLHWDVPLSQQPAPVKAALEQAYPEYFQRGWIDGPSGTPSPDAAQFGLSPEELERRGFRLGVAADQMTGREFYLQLTHEAGGSQGRNPRSQELASRRLAYDGITGIKYLDGVSRGRGKGSYNYVVFDDQAIHIHDVEEARGRYADPAQTDLFHALQQPTSPEALQADRAHATQAFGSPGRAGQAATTLAKESPLVAEFRAKGLPVSADRLAAVKLSDRRGWVDIRGHQVDSPEVVAQLLRPFRSPRMERMHFVLMASDGTILSHQMVTSGAISVVQFAEHHLPDLVARAKRLGATRAILSHNHPSGLPEPSPEDLSYTNYVGAKLQAEGIYLDGHLVIDHTKATWIAPQQTPGGYTLGQTTVQVPGAVGPDWTDAGSEAGRQIAHPGRVAQMVRDVVRPDHFTVLYLDTQHRVVAADPHHRDALDTIPRWLHNHQRAHAAHRVILAADPRLADEITRRVSAGIGVGNQPWARDVLDVVGVPAQPKLNDPTYVSHYERGRITAHGPEKVPAARTVFEESGVSYGRDERAAPAGPAAPTGDALSGPGTEGHEPGGRRAGDRPAGRVPEADRVADLDSAFATVGADVDLSGRLAKAAKKSRPRSLSTRLQRLSDQIANANGPIERLGAVAGSRPHRNPQDLLTYVKASDHTVSLALHTGVLDPITREVAGPSFDSIFAPLHGDDALMERALIYLKAKRDVGRGIGSVRGNIQKWEAAQQVVAFGDADPALSQFAQRWAQYTEAVGQYAVKSGLWTEDLWDRMQASDVLYVRYKRILEDAVKTRGKGSKGGAVKSLGNVTPGVDQFIGSERAIENPAVALAEYTRQIIHRADRYRVGAAVFDAIDDMGPAGEVLARRIPSDDAKVRALSAQQGRQTPLAPEPVLEHLRDLFDPRLDARNPVLWRNAPDGTREFMQIDAPELWSAIMQLHAADEGAVRAFLDVTVRPIKRLFTATTTGWSPRFSLATNPARDVPTALAQSQAKVTLADIARGFAEAAKAVAHQSGLADEAARSGLTGVSIFAQDHPKFVARRAAPLSRADRRRTRLGQITSAPVHALEAAGTATDLGPRLGEYLAAMRRNMAKVRAGEWTLAEARLRAARLGRGVTLDFSNRPGNPVLKLFADYIPFFGVSIQGPTVAAQSAGRNPARFGSVYAAAAVAAVLAWVLKHQLLSDEERAEFNDRNATERSGFLYVPTGGPTLRVPLGQEMGILVQGVTAGLDKFYDDDPAAGALFLAALGRAVPAGMDAMAAGVIPLPGIQQVQENAANRKVFGGRPVEPERMQSWSPAERRYDTTPPTFDLLAAGARRVGIESASPLKAENLVRGVTSSATPLITSLLDPVAARLMGRTAEPSVPRRTRDNPLNPSSSFVASRVASSTESERRFYDLKAKVEQAENDLRTARKAGDRARMRQIEQRSADLLDPGLRRRIGDVDTAMKAIRDAESTLRQQYQRGAVEADETRDRLEALALERHRIVRAALAGESMSRIDRLRYERAVKRAEQASRRMLKRYTAP